jgi:hypothetical protein
MGGQPPNMLAGGSRREGQMLFFDQLIERNRRLIALAATTRSRCWDVAVAATARLQVMQRHASVMHALAADAALAQAKRHVVEYEARIARQQAIVDTLERRPPLADAAMTRRLVETTALALDVLAAMQATLYLGRQHVARLTQQQRSAVGPPAKLTGRRHKPHL